MEERRIYDLTLSMCGDERSDSGIMPNALFVCHTLPYPPDGGVFIRSYHLLRELSRSFDVTAVCFERSGFRDTDANVAVNQLTEFASTSAFPVPQEESYTRKIVDHLRSLISGRVFTVYKHDSKAVRRHLRRKLEHWDVDLIHLDSLDLSCYLPLLNRFPVVCGHHNIESQLLRRRAEVESNPLVGWYIEHQADLQQQEEQRWCDQVELNITVSEEDRQTLERIVPGANVEVIPNGVDIEVFSPEYSCELGNVPDEADVVFVGGAGWFPNRDGMEYFGDEILPELRYRLDNVSVTWVGAADGATQKRIQEKYGIHMTGFVDDVRPYLKHAQCFVVPLRVGGGSRLKILDAWAMGKAVVSTAQGCEGLETRDGENILIRDEPQEFAEAVTRVTRDSGLRDRLGRAGRRTVVESYSWRRIGERMNQVYAGLID